MIRLLLVLVLLNGVSFAQSYSYDYNTGNSYNTTPNYGGGSTTYGFNSNTGKSWTTTTQSNGNSTGFDSNGNYWNYNKSTGSYWNSNGTSCTGTGFARVCN